MKPKATITLISALTVLFIQSSVSASGQRFFFNPDLIKVTPRSKTTEVEAIKDIHGSVIFWHKPQDRLNDTTALLMHLMWSFDDSLNLLMRSTAKDANITYPQAYYDRLRTHYYGLLGLLCLGDSSDNFNVEKEQVDAAVRSFVSNPKQKSIFELYPDRLTLATCLYRANENRYKGTPSAAWAPATIYSYEEKLDDYGYLKTKPIFISCKNVSHCNIFIDNSANPVNITDTIIAFPIGETYSVKISKAGYKEVLKTLDLTKASPNVLDNLEFTLVPEKKTNK